MSFWLGGLRIDRYGFKSSIEAAYKGLNEGIRIFFVNAHCVNVAQTSSEYREAVNHAEMVLNDGAGISLAGSLLGKPFPENLNGTDWIPAFLNYLDLQQEGLRIFLLGENEATLQKVSEIFLSRWPHLQIVGMHQGFYEHPSAPIEALWDASPDLLIVGMGVPKQELFIDEYWEALKGAGLKGAIGAGALFKFLVEEVPRAPDWVRKIHCEWLWRLFQEPKRLWKRYLLGNIKFMILVIKEKFKH